MTDGVQAGFGLRSLLAGMVLLASGIFIDGCVQGPHVLPADQQTMVDRRSMEYPPAFVVKPFMVDLTAPTAECFDSSGTLFVAEGGGTIDDLEPHIFGYRPGAPPDKQYFDVYPIKPTPLGFIPFTPRFHIFGPIGGMVAVNGKLFVAHQDESGNGAITAFGYDGSHTPIVADIPARGDYKMCGMSVDDNGRLYFGVGAATNSGVVGLDNWEEGWVRKYPNFCDVPYVPLKLLGFRFTTSNPLAGLFSGTDNVDTGPFQAFGHARLIHLPGSKKPTGAIYSISQTGGDLKVEAWGVRYPRGIVCGDYHRVYFTDEGMEPRGTRPVLNDPDNLSQLVSRGVAGTWYGGGQYSREYEPISEEKYQPSPEMLRDTGYPEISGLIDESASHLTPPDKANWLKGTFLPQSGAAGVDIVPNAGPFKEYRGSIVVAQFGGRTPFSTGGPNGVRLNRPTGYKVVRVDLVTREVTDFVYNTRQGPASALDQAQGLERPVDVKFGPDGAMYILDYGTMDMKDGRQKAGPHTGKIWRLVPNSPETK